MRRVFYFLNPVVLGLTSLLLIPALVVAASPQAWAQIAVGQAIGAVGAVLVGLGWGINGPNVIANLGRPAQVGEYDAALRARGLVYVAVVPVVAVVVAALTTGGAVAPVVAAAATCANGLSPSWFFVGTAEPRRWFLLDTVPRAIANLAAAGVAAALGWVVPALVIAGLGAVSGVVVATRAIRAGAPRPQPPTLRESWTRVRAQRSVVLASAVTMVYAATPVALVNQVVPGLAPEFALLDRMHKQAQTGLAPLVQITQHSVARGEADGVAHRARRAGLRIGVALAVIGVAYALLAPFVAHLLGAGLITITAPVAALSAVVIVAQVVEQFGAKALLASVGRMRAIAVANISGAIVGLALLAPAALTWGLMGALAAIAVGYGVTIAIDVVVFVRAVRRPRS